MPRYITIDKEYEGQRLDNFLIRELKGVPKSRIYRIIRKGEVRINKKRVKCDTRLMGDDVLRLPPIRESAPVEHVPCPANLILTIKNALLYEDKKLIILNKPAGIAVHGGSGIKLGLIEILRQMYPLEKHLELVHRIDRDTSGCVMIAKKRSMLRELHELIREGRIRKVYTAFVAGEWPQSLKRIDKALSKNVLQSGERMAVIDPEGKVAITKIKVLKHFPEATLLEIILQTGRMHQIRVHTMDAGYPVIGDDKYGDKQINRQFKKRGFQRMFLHASALSFTLPSTDESIRVKAPLDAEWDKFICSQGGA